LRESLLFVGRGSRFFAVHVSTPPEPSIASPHFYVLRAESGGKINPHFLVWLLNSKHAQRFYAEHIEGSSLPYISRKTLAGLPVNLPDMQTQQRIVRAYACWHKERRLREELIKQKKALIEGVLEQYIHQGVVA
jgi:restriction endonuclease S subunit